jgi:hypothetical protein
VQIEKALKGDTKAASFVSTWVERSIEDRRQAKKWTHEYHLENAAFMAHDNSAFDYTREPSPENTAFMRRPRDAASSTTSTSVTAPDESVPVQCHAPEPIEEKPRHDYEGLSAERKSLSTPGANDLPVSDAVLSEHRSVFLRFLNHSSR